MNCPYCQAPVEDHPDGRITFEQGWDDVKEEPISEGDAMTFRCKNLLCQAGFSIIEEPLPVDKEKAST